MYYSPMRACCSATGSVIKGSARTPGGGVIMSRMEANMSTATCYTKRRKTCYILYSSTVFLTNSTNSPLSFMYSCNTYNPTREREKTLTHRDTFGGLSN